MRRGLFGSCWWEGWVEEYRVFLGTHVYMPIIQIIFVAVFCWLAYATWRRRNHGAVSRGEAVAWTLLWLAGAGVAARPEVASFAARVIGVGRGSDLVLYVSVALLFWLAFRVLLRLERMERDITTLTRELAKRDADKGE